MLTTKDAYRRPLASFLLPTVLAGACLWLAPVAAAQAAVQLTPLSKVKSATEPYAACPPAVAHRASCYAVVDPPAAKLADLSIIASPATGGPEGSGLGASELRSAYAIGSTGGSSDTVAIVDAYNDPNAESDLVEYRRVNGLPLCDEANSCFSKVSQTGSTHYPENEAGWSVEISLDLDMVSAICPYCHIDLVEASSSSFSDLAAAENEAARLGATAISNSWGAPEESGDSAENSAFEHPGIPITVASGDYGYDNREAGADAPSYPASSPDVIAVGGTNLAAAGNSRGWDETVWAHTGSGCSAVQAKPAYQKDSGCSHRTTNDVAAVAEDLSIFDDYEERGWMTVGGTSAATPIVASVEALSSSSARTAAAAKFYEEGTSLFDVSSGSNGSCGSSYLCTGKAGYDAPTGNGSPDGVVGSGGGGSGGESERPSGPTVTSISPAEGTTKGSTSVTIKGTLFVKGATVTIGGAAATSVTVKKAGEITAKTPAGSAGSAEVVVSDSAGTSSAGATFTYVAPPLPAASSVSPDEGYSEGGTTITVKGSHFVNKALSVEIGSVKATSVVWHSESEVTAKTAKGTAGAHEVVVDDTNGDGTEGPTFTYTTAPRPTVSAVSPNEGPVKGSTTITVTGTGFIAGSTVKIGSLSAGAVSIKSETRLTAKTPKGTAGAHEVVVTTKRGTSTSGPSFTYTAGSIVRRAKARAR